MTRYSLKIIILMAAATMLLTACTDEQTAEQQRMPITLTTSILPTRAIADPTQETQLASGEKVYVWAKGSDAAWTADNYLKAWTLTANGSGALTGSTQYYPDGALSLVAIHGNFSFTEGTDVYPGTVEHSVAADQNTASGYEKSDLMHWSITSQTATASPVTLAFEHKLSKLEISLIANSDYTADDLDKATVEVCNVMPIVSMSLADGTISEAYGTPINITPRKTGQLNYEVIVPPQAKPLDMIQVTLGGTVIKVDAQVTELEANTKYPYDISFTYKDVRMNPLWYVAEYNVNYDGSSTYSWATTPDEGYYLTWNDAYTAARQFDGWHLPSSREYASIAPGFDSDGTAQNIFKLDESGSGTYKGSLTKVVFGYNELTTSGFTEDSYWVKISDTEIHALRFLGTDYCSAWKYVLDVSNYMFIISSTLIGNVENSSSAAQAWYNANWNNVYFGNNEPIGAVQKIFYARKYTTEGNSTTYNTATDVMYGTYWSSQYNTRFWFGMSGGYGSHINGLNPSWGCSVRLFRNGTFSWADLVTVNDIGKVIGSDGNLYNHKNDVPAPFVASAMIAYVGPNTDNSEYTHGIAVALEDGTYPSPYLSGNSAPGKADCVWSVANYTKERPYGASEWLLPSIEQFKRMFQTVSGEEGGCGGQAYVATTSHQQVYQYGNFRSNIVSCGGTDLQEYHYWSSTTAGSSRGGWNYRIQSTHKMIWDDGLTNGGYARAVFCF